MGVPDRRALCIAFVAREEGGWVDDPDDAGGATMKGITLGTLREWRHDPDVGRAELRAISDAEVTAIYNANYWQRMMCGSLPPGVDLMVFDHGVNAGSQRSVQLLQSLVPVNSVDGWMGPATLAAVRSVASGPLVARLRVKQEAFYRSRPAFWKFGKGWLARLDRRETAAKAAAG